MIARISSTCLLFGCERRRCPNAPVWTTKAIVPVHYVGVSCEMDTIMKIADKYGLYVVEDATQGMMSSYHDKHLGTIGHIGAYGFHETKNFTSGGEGGLLIVNDEKFIERVETIREKGTNRSQFFRGMVDKYTWIDIGSSYLINELSATYLWAQLEKADGIIDNRLSSWSKYYHSLKDLMMKTYIELPTISSECSYNGDMFYIKVKDRITRKKLITYLNEKGVLSVFYYIPLHSSPAGLKYGRFNEEDLFTTKESERVLRLPMYYNLRSSDIEYIIEKIKDFFYTKV